MGAHDYLGSHNERNGEAFIVSYVMVNEHDDVFHPLNPGPSRVHLSAARGRLIKLIKLDRAQYTYYSGARLIRPVCPPQPLCHRRHSVPLPPLPIHKRHSRKC